MVVWKAIVWIEHIMRFACWWSAWTKHELQCATPPRLMCNPTISLRDPPFQCATCATPSFQCANRKSTATATQLHSYCYTFTLLHPWNMPPPRFDCEFVLRVDSPGLVSNPSSAGSFQLQCWCPVRGSDSHPLSTITCRAWVLCSTTSRAVCCISEHFRCICSTCRVEASKMHKCTKTFKPPTF